MKLSELTNTLNGILAGDDVDIKGISTDSRVKQKGYLFICLEGKNFDSHNFVTQAVKNGAVAVIISKPIEVDICQYIVNDTRNAYSVVSSKFWSEPQKKLKMVAVTGTNGKTSTAFMLKKVFDQAKIKAAYIGTLFIEYGDKRIDAKLTTPDPDILFELLAKMVKEKVRFVFMEASAHALHLCKLDSICFDLSIFTNITRDHLDFFVDMDSYKKAKLKLFSPKHSKYAVVNVDNEIGLDLYRNAKIPVVSYGLANPADVFALDIYHTEKGLEFTVNQYDVVYDIQTNLLGTFNVSNILAVCATAGFFGIGIEDIKKALKEIEIPGRFNLYVNKARNVKAIVDYAHTPDGLKKVLISALDYTEGNLITVFGCGGDRDQGKRKEMGAVASALSDYVIITNDNPRTEDPRLIAEQIEAGILEDADEEIILDRVKAIKRAFELADSGDVIVIAGKGPENYMEVNGVKIPYSDKEVVESCIK